MKKIISGLIVSLLAAVSAPAQINSDKLQNKYVLADHITNLVSNQWAKDSQTIESWSNSLKHTINKQLIMDELAIRYTIDSLQALQLPTDKFTLQLTSLTYKKESLLSEVTAKKDDLAQKTKSRLQEWQNTIKANSGLNSLEHPTRVNIPAINQSCIPPELPNLNHPFVQSMSNISLPALPVLSAGDFQQVELSPDLSFIHKSLPFKDVEGLKHIQRKFGSLKDGVSQLTSFTKNSDNPINTAFENIIQLSGFQEKIEAAENMPLNDFLIRAEQMEDPKALKESAQKEIIKEAFNHFKGREERLNQAIEKMAKYKQKFSSVNSIQEIPKISNGKSLNEHLFLGIAFQIQRKNYLSLDFNPYLGYRFTNRLTTGLGWNQRFAFNNWTQTSQKGEIYGPRAYTEFKVWKGFSPRLEVEYMKYLIPPSFLNTPFENYKREWIFGSKIGIKKEYPFRRNIKGTVIVMFKFTNSNQNYSDHNIWNMRFGLEFPIQKKKVSNN
ncbi:hypothetical protein AHMF7605_29130 [Adhaeribacter arboris]|uniref:DUF3078 domain-containing protein n=1 Tax=Adhaeribacter arboris TaxID=2072846 RepID=A0A2T2Y8Z6_9BACT|nr:hypothetical protein [Adhaeribacter arboris]PSR51973.1 hypothetical protein AHMF7605_29130 [Adhaeribacter arboris]